MDKKLNGFNDGLHASSGIGGKELFSFQLYKKEETPYCTDCGNDDLAYLDQYANGNYWKCKECKKEFIW